MITTHETRADVRHQLVHVVHAGRLVVHVVHAGRLVVHVVHAGRLVVHVVHAGRLVVHVTRRILIEYASVVRVCEIRQHIVHNVSRVVERIADPFGDDVEGRDVGLRGARVVGLRGARVVDREALVLHGR